MDKQSSKASKLRYTTLCTRHASVAINRAAPYVRCVARRQLAQLDTINIIMSAVAWPLGLVCGLYTIVMFAAIASSARMLEHGATVCRVHVYMYCARSSVLGAWSLVRVALVAIRHESKRRHDLVLDNVIPFSPLLFLSARDIIHGAVSDRSFCPHLLICTHLGISNLLPDLLERDFAERQVILGDEVLRVSAILQPLVTCNTYNLAERHNVLATDEEHANVDVAVLELKV